jgi:hypothetical protein
MDVKTTFLNGNIEPEAEIFMEQPQSLPSTASDSRLLHKALYGLKQSPRQWYFRLHEFLIKLGLTRSEADHSVYVHHTEGWIIAVYVDDLLLLAKSAESSASASHKLETLKMQLASEFQMADMGPVAWFLGMRIKRLQDGSYRLDQAHYIEDLLQKFQASSAVPVSTPMEAGFINTLRKSAAESPLLSSQEHSLYQSIIGSLMYAMLGSRPDLAYTVGVLGRFASEPQRVHMLAARRTLKYLKGTVDFGLLYRAGTSSAGEPEGPGAQLYGFTDASWGDLEDRKSTGAYIFLLSGAAISWASKKQRSVALSSTEAEYMALTQATKEAIWLSKLLTDLKQESSAGIAVTIAADNQSCIALSRNPEYHARTKHIDIQHHFVREAVENEEIGTEFCPTGEMVADALTKPLPAIKHQFFMEKMGLSES